MTAKRTRLFLTLAIAPLALGLAACKQEAAAPAGEAPKGEAVAAVAPPAGKAWTDVVEVTADGGYRVGNPNAPIKLMEFGALSCSHCAEFSEAASAELLGQFVASGRVSYELRNFVRDAIDITATQLTQCGTPETFFALTDQVFAYQAGIFEKAQSASKEQQQAAFSLPPAQRGPALGELTGLTEYVTARGISKDQANACLADAAKAEKLAAQTQAAGEQYQIEGTPTFLLNGQKTDYNTWDKLKADLERLGAR